MLSGNIDLDRGVTLKITADGVEVYMYKDEPGVYRNAYGAEVSEQLAAHAGFETAKLGKLRRRKELMAKAAMAIDQELEAEVEVGQRKVIKSRKNYTLTAIGLGRHIIQDPDGITMHERPLTLEQAEKLFEMMVPADPDEKAPLKAAKAPPRVAPVGGKKAE